MDPGPKRNAQTLKLLEGNIGENLPDLGVGKDILDTEPETRSVKETADKLDSIKIKKNFYPAQNKAERARRPAIDGERTFTKDTTDL